MQNEHDRDSLEETLHAYLDTLNHADWDGFRRFFMDDATAFSPWATFSARETGRDAVGEAFRPAFARWRATLPGLPYVRIIPEDLHIQMLDDIAITTFYARDEPSLGRRTLVWCRSAVGWKVVHLHASYLGPVADHAGEAPSLGRRTLVWQHGAEGWKIAHLHSSDLVRASESPTE